MPGPLLALVGPTASGKSEAAIEIAAAMNAEIVSVDSMLVYRGMDVGTAKPTQTQRSLVPHHLLDVAEPTERFTVARYQELGREVLGRVATAGRRSLLTGGSGLYYRALVDDLVFPPEDPEARTDLEREALVLGAEGLYRRLAIVDPAAAAKMTPRNGRRIVRALEVMAATGERFSSFSAAWDRYPAERVRAAGVRMPPEALRSRIQARIGAMLAAGWVAEVRGLMERGFGGWLTATQAIGYSELARHLEGRLSLEEAVGQTVKRTWNLARRQAAWFGRDPRIRWFDVDEAGASRAVGAMLAHLEGP
jgi:tRNA dimethylallyltransferase